MKMRYNKYEKTILTDCDGVLLDWEWAFNCWMIQHGFETTEGYQLSMIWLNVMVFQKNKLKNL